MKKRTIALLLLTALLGILLTSCGEDERNHYSPGYWRDNVFYDAFVDLRFTLPDGWEATRLKVNRNLHKSRKNSKEHK